MKVCVLRNEYEKREDLAYIFYYPRKKEWYIELPEGIDEWELPFILDSFARNGEWSINSYWSRRFVTERIVPPNRQNIGAILRDNNLEEYDEFALFMIADGRCAQDECYIKEISTDGVPEEILKRKESYLETAMVIDNSILLTLKNGEVFLVDNEVVAGQYDWYKRLLSYARGLSGLRVDVAGNALMVTESKSLSAEYLKSAGKKLPVDAKLLREYACNEIISTGTAMKILGCTRQNIDDLVKRGRLTPAPVDSTSRMFFRSEVEGL